MAGGGGDVVAVARIVAAQRPVGALDDPLGAFDDAVERRAQHFVERMVERSGRADRPRAWPRRFGFGGAAEARETAVGGGHDFAAQARPSGCRRRGCARAGR